MAMPMLAGPGAIASIMLLMSGARGSDETLVILAALAAVLVLTMLSLIAAGPLIRLLGDRVEAVVTRLLGVLLRSEEHTSELQSLMRISYAVFCLKKKKTTKLRKSSHHIAH